MRPVETISIEPDATQELSRSQSDVAKDESVDISQLKDPIAMNLRPETSNDEIKDEIEEFSVETSIKG